MTLLHVTSERAWEAGPPCPPERGFLHMCTPDQLGFVLARHFAGRVGLVVLHVAVDADDARLRWEVSEAGMAAFPHFHGALTRAMVVRVECYGGRAQMRGGAACVVDGGEQDRLVSGGL